MAEITLAVIGFAGNIANNLLHFINRVRNCSREIRTLLQIVLNVQRDTERVRQAAAELSLQPNASTLASELLLALESLEGPLRNLNQRLGDLHRGQPTPFILAYRYEACRNELEAFQRQIALGYHSLQLFLLLARQ
jgi:hypothetical protein